jgi:hypothetical protein
MEVGWQKMSIGIKFNQISRVQRTTHPRTEPIGQKMPNNEYTTASCSLLVISHSTEGMTATFPEKSPASRNLH